MPALRPRLPDAFTVSFGDGVDLGLVTLAQPGLAAMINATAAVAMARVLLGDRFDIRKLSRPFASWSRPSGAAR